MYMLLQVDKEENGVVEGAHIQWCCACSLKEAITRARETEKVNGNHITVAVIDELYDSYTTNRLLKNKKRLDK